MRLRLILALSFALSIALIACAKKSAAPTVTAAAPPAPSSHVSIAMASSGIKADLSGPTFAQFDPSSRQLTVFAFRGDSLPTPSCDDLSAFKLTTGGLVTLQVPKFAQSEGTFFVLGAGYFEQDPKTEKLTMGSDTLSATIIDVRAYDENTLTAEIRTTAAEDAPRASGAVVATMCPPKEVAFTGEGSSSQGKMRSSGGPPAPRLDGRSVNGDRVSVSLAALKGKIVIVDFWATWCGPCNRWFPRLVEFEAKYRSRGVVVIGVSLDDEATPIAGFARKYGVTFPLVWDQGKRIASLWRPSGIPSTFVIDRTGAVSYHHEGFSDNDERDLESAVKKVF